MAEREQRLNWFAAVKARAAGAARLTIARAVKRPLGYGLAGLAALLCVADLPGDHAAGAPPAGIGAQFVQIGAPSNPNDDQGTEGIFNLPNRDIDRRLARAKKLLADNQYGDALNLLDDLLQEKQDYRLRPEPNDRSPENSNGRFVRGLKAEAQRMIGTLPSDGLKSYEMMFGAKAERMLADALAASDMEGVSKVSRMYFHTEAGFRATLLLGHYNLDHNQPLAAALCFQRLRDSSAAASLEPSLSVLLTACWARGGDSARAYDALTQLRKNYPGATVKIAGKPVPLPADDLQALVWLRANLGPQQAGGVQPDQWTMARGNPARNALSDSAMPLLNLRWRVPTTGEAPEAEKLAATTRQASVDRNTPVLPEMQPLAVGDYVLMRTARDGLRGVNLVTGKRIWPAAIPAKTAPEVANQQAQVQQVLGAFPGGRFVVRGGVVMQEEATVERTGDNPVLGTMSSDGENVFLIEEQTSPAPRAVQRGGFRLGGGMPEIPPATNVLSAWGIADQGKFKWKAGGYKQPHDTETPELEGAYFLGAPLPLMGKLYVMAEIKGEIRLEVLDGKTGKLQWEQQLVSASDPNQQPLVTFWRYSGASPSYSDGVLVCPTSAGAVVAVDLATRTLLWGYAYQRNQQPSNGQQVVMVRIGGGRLVPRYVPLTTGTDHWADATATLADGRVLLTPADANQMFCLNLVDGKLLWTRDRNSNLYVGGVQGTAPDEKVLLVGKGEVQAMKLSDGTPAWNLTLPDGALPSGRGFMTAGNYFLPLSTGEVARIDAATGKITGRAKSRKGCIPGNLICYKGQIISQGVDFLYSFYQIDPLVQSVIKRLAENPDDPFALADRGDIELDDGKVVDAIADLRHSLEKKTEKSEPRARELLVEGLLTALRTDFPKWRDHLGEVEKLITSDEERIDYLRILGDGRLKTGDKIGALEAYLNLADLPWDPSEPETVEPNLSVRRDAWVQARLQALYAVATPDERFKVDAALTERVGKAVASSHAASGSPASSKSPASSTSIETAVDKLRLAIRCFGFHRAADEARARLLAQTKSTLPPLERESLLRQLERSSDPVRRRAAVAQLAALYGDHARNIIERPVGPRQPGDDGPKRPPEADAVAYYRQLAGEFADQVCLDGKTGRQLVAQLPASSPIVRLLGEPNAWPSGRVTVDHGGRSPRPQNQQQHIPAIEWRGARGPFFESSNIEFDQQQQPTLIGRDGLGREQFRLLLNQQNPNFGQTQPVAGLTYATAQGHLLFANFGTELVALDTLSRSPANGAPNGAPNIMPNGAPVGESHILWSRDLLESPANMQNGREIKAHQINSNAVGLSRSVPEQSADGPLIGVVGPITEHVVCIARSHDLTAYDPLTGAVLWTRHGLPSPSEIFGDDEVLFVAPPEGGDATVLRTADGQVLGTRTVPPVDLRAAYHGRRIIFGQSGPGGKLQLLLADRWKNAEQSLGKFSMGTKAAPVGDDALAIFDGKSGAFQIVSLDDGHKLIDEQLEPDPSLAYIFVQKSGGQYLLLAGRGARGESGGGNPFGENAISPAVSGRLYAFDAASGKKLWPSPATVNQQRVMLGHGEDLPIVVFLKPTPRGAQQANGNGEVRHSMLCVDRRTGRALFDDPLPHDFNIDNADFEIVGNRQEKSIKIAVQQNLVTLQFSDDPTPPEPPYRAELARRQARLNKLPLGAAPPLRAIHGQSGDDSDGEGDGE